jgi:hypothetical protein
MTTEVKEQPTREYGLTVMVQGDGKITITPHNLVNDFEFAGLVEYLGQKKSDLLKTIGMSIEHRNMQATGYIAKVLELATTKTAQGVEASSPQAG